MVSRAACVMGMVKVARKQHSLVLRMSGSEEFEKSDVIFVESQD
jgi:hypothetical protein